MRANKKNPWTDGYYTESDVIILYKSGLSARKIAETLNLKSHGIILRILERNEIKAKTNSEYRKKYFFNEGYFSKIDSEEKAYFLGLLYSDGNVCMKGRKPRIQLTLANEDSYILQKFLDVIGYKGKMYIDRLKYTKAAIYSEEMARDLIKLGCIPNKSLILDFPTYRQVPKELIRHFIRGFFDGDGSISINNKNGYTCNFTSCSKFLNGLRKVLLENTDIKLSKFYPRYKERENSCGSAYHYETKQHNPLYNYMYIDSSLWLKRKKEKIENFVYGR